MKTSSSALILLILIWFVAARANAQTGFQNLNFESGTLVPIPNDQYERVYADLALPHWTVYSGANRVDAVLNDAAFIGSTGISIVDSSWRGVLSGDPVGAIEGSFSVLLQAGTELGTSTQPADLTLTQTGLVPPGARSIWFLGHAAGAPSSLNPLFAVSLGGVNLDLTSIPGGPDSTTLYGADISPFAGQAGALSLTLFSPLPHGEAYLYLDAIRFSPDPVPEPGALLLIGLGLMGIAWSRHVSHSRRRKSEKAPGGNGVMAKK